jgi:hypothetical protein
MVTRDDAYSYLPVSQSTASQSTVTQGPAWVVVTKIGNFPCD